jgi:hypothetical protein
MDNPNEEWKHSHLEGFSEKLEKAKAELLKSQRLSDDIPYIIDQLMNQLSQVDDEMPSSSNKTLVALLEKLLNCPDVKLRARIERVIEELNSYPEGKILEDREVTTIESLLP